MAADRCLTRRTLKKLSPWKDAASSWPKRTTLPSQDTLPPPALYTYVISHANDMRILFLSFSLHFQLKKTNLNSSNARTWINEIIFFLKQNSTSNSFVCSFIRKVSGATRGIHIWTRWTWRVPLTSTNRRLRCEAADNCTISIFPRDQWMNRWRPITRRNGRLTFFDYFDRAMCCTGPLAAINDANQTVVSALS